MPFHTRLEKGSFGINNIIGFDCKKCFCPKIGNKKGIPPSSFGLLDGYPPNFKQRADAEQCIDISAVIQDPVQGLPARAKASREVFLAMITVLDALLDLFHYMLGRAFVGKITHGRYLLRRPNKELKKDRPTL